MDLVQLVILTITFEQLLFTRLRFFPSLVRLPWINDKGCPGDNPMKHLLAEFPYIFGVNPTRKLWRFTDILQKKMFQKIAFKN